MSEQQEQFGNYRAVRKVGQGATGVVFEAERLGGDFTHRVAIKVVPGAAAATLPESETRILARLEHPNIARLLDAGSTRAGLRYLVMEYVDGVPCTDYATQHKLGETARLRLFLEICEAVHYANRSLVVHCDLKPANVLVTPEGSVKLLDFGISRVLSDSSGDRTTRVRFYSPNYASPEQILGRPLTVATDVYSLGALLCELVGGRAPRSLDEASPEDALAAIEREGEPGALALTGDLEQIARKALRADPAQRYPTVANLAADVRRYLDGEPIEARPPSRWYRARKFIGRHRMAVAAAALVTAALLATTVYALRQRRLANERFAHVRGLANSVLFEIHDEIAKLPGSLSARHLVVNRGVEYLDALSAGAGADAALQLEAAKGFVRLADIEGVGNEVSLGQSGQALPRVEKADAMVRAVLAREPRNFEALHARYQTLEALATIYSFRADQRDVPTAEEFLRVSEQILRARPNEARAQEEHAHALAKVANAYTQSGKFGEKGVEAWARATEAWKKLYAAGPKSVTRKRELARAYQYHAGALSRARKREEALAMIAQAAAMHRELIRDTGEDQHMLAADVGLQANLTAQMKRYAEAIPLFEEQLQLREAMLKRDPSNTNAAMGVAGTMDRIGYAYVLLKRPVEGLPYLERALASQRLVYAKDPDNILVNREMFYVLSDLTDAHEVLKRRDRMCGLAKEAAALIQGPLSRTRETSTDAAKKKYVTKILAACGA
ncbi:MAG: serine/threonine protein kinase [Bryobacterales bacterium]|nr:serine/threonine protein kinase [Bryobacterales bacterium]